ISVRVKSDRLCATLSTTIQIDSRSRGTLMKRKLVSRAIPSALVAGGLIIASAVSATAAGDDSTSSTDTSSGGLGSVLTDTVDAVAGKDGAVDTTLTQVGETVGQVT